MMASATSAVMTGMAGTTTTATGSAAMASSTAMSHGGGGMSMGGSCKISVRFTSTPQDSDSKLTRLADVMELVYRRLL